MSGMNVVCFSPCLESTCHEDHYSKETYRGAHLSLKGDHPRGPYSGQSLL